MASAISAAERQRAYVALGVSSDELEHIELAVPREQETLFKRFIQRVRKTYKRLAHELHPDRNGGDVEKSRFFVVLSEVLAELRKREPRAGSNVTLQVSGSRPRAKVVMRVHVGRSRSSVRTGAALRFAKMRP